MTNLEFSRQFNTGVLRNGRIRRIAGGSTFRYNGIQDSSIRYITGDAEIPYIMTNRLHSSVIMRISYEYQWYGSSFTMDMLKSIMDTAEMPVPVKVLYQRVYYSYLIGKGFLAKLSDTNKMTLLFVACKPANIPNNRLHMRNITFYISKSIKDASVPKKIRDIIEDFADNHVGDVFYTNDIDKYIGHNIKYPTFSTIPQKKEYIGKLIDFCTEKIRKSL